MKNILVFASKKVGFFALQHVLLTTGGVERVIVSDDTDSYNRSIIKVLNNRRIPYDLYNSTVERDIVAENKRYQWLLNLWSPHILTAGVLSLAKHRLNIHSGLVPGCRGNDNAAWCIRLRLPAGASLLEMDTGIDKGDIYVDRQVPYTFPIRGIILHNKIQRTCVRLFQEYWEKIYSGSMKTRRQTGKIHTFTRKQTERDRVRSSTDSMTLEDVINWAYAHDFYPGTTGQIRYNGAAYSVQMTFLSAASKRKDVNYVSNKDVLRKK